MATASSSSQSALTSVWLAGYLARTGGPAARLGWYLHLAKIAMQVDIAAPVDLVFDFVADYRNALYYMHQFQSFEPVTAQTFGLGARVKASGRLRGIPVSTELEVVVFEKDRRLVSVSQRGLRSVSKWSFEPQGSATRVTFSAEFAVPRLPLAGAVVEKLLEEEIRTGARRTLENLKRILEDRQNGSSASKDL